MELARLMALHPPRRSVIVVATAGHFEGLAGIRDLVYFLQGKPEQVKGQGTSEQGNEGTGGKERLALSFCTINVVSSAILSSRRRRSLSCAGTCSGD